jgi:hypothetical protein
MERSLRRKAKKLSEMWWPVKLPLKFSFKKNTRLSSMIKHQATDDFSDKRIRELKQEIETLTQELSVLASHTRLTIQCDIIIKVESKED